MPTVPTEQLRRECNTRDQGHQGNYFTDSPKLATVCWRRKEGCRPCKSLSERRREVRGKGEKHQRERAQRRQRQEPRGRGGQRPQREERERWVHNTPRQKPSREVRGEAHSHDDFSWCWDFNRLRWSGRERWRKLGAFFFFFFSFSFFYVMYSLLSTRNSKER